VLVVFDIDGTLTKTDGLDADLYLQALHETHGIRLADDDWQACRSISDRGIAEEVLARRFGRPARVDELRRLHDRFVTLLGAALPRADRLQVPGAGAILDRLRAAGHMVAVATGCWYAAAVLKLARAAIATDGVPLASSDDHPAREEILALAVARAGAVLRRDRIVYVGDGPWDVAATRSLGIPFVGIDYADRHRLVALGVATVLRDFSDPEAFLDAVTRAEPPPPPGRRRGPTTAPPAAGPGGRARRRAGRPRPR
jgi:phosphoglycolate phosphatase-like HAD superfamily hydrolase